MVLSAYSQQGDPALYEVYYSGLKRFIESVLDCHRAELSQVFYPLFVHMYLELVYNSHENEAKAFYKKWVLASPPPDCRAIWNNRAEHWH